MSSIRADSSGIPSPTSAAGLIRRRKASMADRREARSRLREEVEKQIEQGKSGQEAVDAAMDAVEAEYAAAGIDWVTLLPFLIEFIMLLLEGFRKPSSTGGE